MQKSTWLQRFFFVTYAAFLLPSIPHIASYFLAFEGYEQGYSLIFWIGVSYLIAIAIDGTLLWLTHTIARSTVKSGWYHAVIWAFILFLVAFSGYLNWHIAQHNAGIASEQLSGAFIPHVDPVIASLFPVLAIMYAVMSRHVFAETKTETLAEKAARLETEKELRERIARARPSVIQWGKGKALELKHAKDEIFGTELPSQRNEDIPSEGQQKERDTGPIVNPLVPLDGTEIQEQEEYTEEPLPTREEKPIEQVEEMLLFSSEENSMDESVTENVPDESIKDMAKTPSTGSSTVTFEEAAQITGYSVSTLKKYASQGKVKRSKRDSNSLLVSSLVGVMNPMAQAKGLSLVRRLRR